jgi:tRNA pseudouridine32 synthase / 23S rRNA pseudouridine746 synthase
VTTVLYESAAIVIIDKPAGVPTIPDRFGSDCVHAAVCRERGERLWVVHRLDREVTGVLVFARTAEAHRRLSMAFEHHDVHKTYEALSDGTYAAGEHRFENKLLRGKKRAYVSPHGKVAITVATCLGPSDQGLRWRLSPITGRNHQLRVHLAGVGCPIRGDVLYGATSTWSVGVALRAVAIELPAVGDEPAGTHTAPTLFESK